MNDATLAAWVQAGAAVASLLATAGLAVLTWIYVRHTRRMADQMVQQGEPVVIGRIEPFGNLYAQFVLTNVGLGPALNVELELKLDHESVWRDDLLEPGKSEFFFLPVDGGTANSAFKTLGEMNKELIGTLRFQDRSGRSYPAKNIRVNFRQLNADWDHAHWQIRKSDVLQNAAEVTDAVEDLTKRVKEIADTLKGDLAPLTTHTGLNLSITTLRNLRHLLAGSDELELMDPVAGGHQVLAEVLAIDYKTAFKIWNHFRGHSGVAKLEDVEGVTPDLAQRVRKYFRDSGS
jgi:molybdopterin converting factor small subunit